MIDRPSAALYAPMAAWVNRRVRRTRTTSRDAYKLKAPTMISPQHMTSAIGTLRHFAALQWRVRSWGQTSRHRRNGMTANLTHCRSPGGRGRAAPSCPLTIIASGGGTMSCAIFGLPRCDKNSRRGRSRSRHVARSPRERGRSIGRATALEKCNRDDGDRSWRSGGCSPCRPRFVARRRGHSLSQPCTRYCILRARTHIFH